MGEQLVNRRIRTNSQFVFERYVVLEVDSNSNADNPKVFRDVDTKFLHETNSGDVGGLQGGGRRDWQSVYEEWLSRERDSQYQAGAGVGIFCFPFVSIKQYISYKDEDMFTFVLTDSEGWQQFGFCALRSSIGNVNAHISNYTTHTGNSFSQNQSQRGSVRLYCFCFLSYLPWFEFFDCLLNAAISLDNGTSTVGFSTELVSLLSKVYLRKNFSEPGSMCAIPVSMRFTFRAKVPVDSTRIIVPLPENKNLTLLFNSLSTFHIMNIFAALLLERRILVFSSKLSLLTSCMHGLGSILYPLYWQHIFIPIMPFSLSDYCSAPMPYLMGIHRSILSHVQSLHLEEVILVDLDKDEVATPFNDIKLIPRSLVIPLFDTLKIYEKQKCISSGDKIPLAFLNFFVQLFGSYRHFFGWKAEGDISDSEHYEDRKKTHYRNEMYACEEESKMKYYCDIDSFVVSKPSSWKTFTEQFFNLQMFQQLVAERIHHYSEQQSTVEDLSVQLEFLMGKKSLWEEALDQFDSNDKNNLEYSGNSQSEHVWDRLVSYAEMKRGVSRKQSLDRPKPPDSLVSKPNNSSQFVQVRGKGKFFAGISGRRKNYAAVSQGDEGDDMDENDALTRPLSETPNFTQPKSNPKLKHVPKSDLGNGIFDVDNNEPTVENTKRSTAKSMQLIDLDFDPPLFQEKKSNSKGTSDSKSIDDIFSMSDDKSSATGGADALYFFQNEKNNVNTANWAVSSSSHETQRMLYKNDGADDGGQGRSHLLYPLNSRGNSDWGISPASSTGNMPQHQPNAVKSSHVEHNVQNVSSAPVRNPSNRGRVQGMSALTYPQPQMCPQKPNEPMFLSGDISLNRTPGLATIDSKQVTGGAGYAYLKPEASAASGSSNRDRNSSANSSKPRSNLSRKDLASFDPLNY